jgi:hypothetical protein
MLALVLPHRHPVGLVDEDVGGLQDRVVEVAGGQPALAPDLRLGLELGHAAQLAEGRQMVEQPGQLRVLGHVGLDEQRAHLGVQAAGEQHGRHLEGPVGHLPVIVGQGDGVQVDHEVQRVEVVLHLHPLPERPDVVPEVEVRRTFRPELPVCQVRRPTRLNAAQDARPCLVVH